MTVGEKLQIYRKRAGLSQEELGTMLFVSRQTVSLWEKDQTLPTVDNLVKLKEIFGVSLDELICDAPASADESVDGESENDERKSEEAEAAPEAALQPDAEEENPAMRFSFVIDKADAEGYDKEALSPLRISKNGIGVCALLLVVLIEFKNPLLALCITAVLIATQIRYFKNRKKLKETNLPTVGAEYEYGFFNEYFILKKHYPDGVGERYDKYSYRDITYYQRIKSGMLIVCRGTTFFTKITENESAGLAELLRVKCPQAKSAVTVTKAEKLSTAVTVLIVPFIAALIICGRLCAVAELSPLFMLVFLAFPVIFIIDGIALSRQKTPNKNVLIGIALVIIVLGIFAVVNLTVNWASGITDTYEVEIDSDEFVRIAEASAKVDLPDEWDFIAYDESETDQMTESQYVFNKAFAVLSEDEHRKAVDFFESDSRWLKEIPAELQSEIPDVYGAGSFGYAMLSDPESGEVNTKSANPYARSYYCMFYVPEDMIFYIYDYTMYD